MTIVNMHEAKSSLSRLVADIEEGRVREVVIARNGRPAARLVSLAPAAGGQRIGVAAGAFTTGEPAALDDAVAALFTGVDE